MEAAWANEASPSSSISTQFKYDVFLSFSGDTRNNFTSHLLDSLERHVVHTFRDDKKLEQGEYIGDALLKAIEESRISLVVLSKNYAASRWCLDELVKIMECKKTLQQIVLPIFYNVEPSEVRKQKGSLAEAFAKHEECLKESSDGRVKKWREALIEVGNLSGWDLPKVANGDEVRLIQKVVEVVRNKLDNIVHLHVACREIGLESRFQNLKLKMEPANVCVVAVWGMGGIGKTTLVKKLYNLIQHKFERSCFLAHIGETSKQPNGLVVLQEQLLSDVLRTRTHNIKNFHHGIEVIKQRACRHKVLLILDDVDDVKQLKALAIDQDSFGFGSRIVVTTRDISVLKKVLKKYEVYEVEKLNGDESLALFSWHCFKEDHPTKDHLDLSRQVVHHAGGHPLALEILGSVFRGNSIPEWKSAIAKLRKIPDNKIQEKLEISFDSLNKEEQDLFLDMACFFVGTDRDFTLKILEGCRHYAVIGIRVLADRCLIKCDCCNNLVMHDMVRDMGREIVRKESRENPGKRSRLWHGEDVLDVLKCGKGTGKVKGLLLHTKDVQVNAKPFEKMMDKLWYRESVLEAPRDSMGTEAVESPLLNLNDPKHVEVNAKAFEKMKNLWLLHLDYVHQTADFEHASRSLLWLSWKGFPLDCLSSNLSMEKLIALDLRYSSLKIVWNGYKILEKLKFLYLSHCHYLTRTPNFSGLNSLEELLLNDCKSLVKVDESIRCLDKLVVLDMKNCTRLRKLPSGIWMLKSLKCLDISGCSKLGNLTELNSIGFSLTFVQAFGCLKELNMANCSLSNLPDGIGNLIFLQTLNLQKNNLITLPDCICNLTCLKHLDLECNNVSHLPSEIGRLTSLEYLNLGFLSVADSLTSSKNSRHQRTRSLTLPDSICSLTRLKCLFLAGCNLSHLPSEIGNLASLHNLRLLENNICTLPDSISNLHDLKYICLNKCAKLQSLPKLPGGCMVSAWDCTSLESLPLELDQLGVQIKCTRSNKLVENDFASRLLKQLRRSKGLAELEKFVDIVVPRVGDVPIWFQYQGEGPNISFVMRHFVKQKMLGWVLCAFFQGFEEGLICSVSVTHRVIRNNKFEKERIYAFELPGQILPACQDHVFLRYTPQGYKGLHLKDGDEVEISILAHYALVKNWGVDLIYEVNENITKTNENQEALIQYTPAPYQDVRHPVSRFSWANFSA